MVYTTQNVKITPLQSSGCMKIEIDYNGVKFVTIVMPDGVECDESIIIQDGKLKKMTQKQSQQYKY